MKIKGTLFYQFALVRTRRKRVVGPSPKFNRWPNLSESRNLTECRMSEVPKCGLNTRHDNREVTFTHLTQAQILRSDK